MLKLFKKPGVYKGARFLCLTYSALERRIANIDTRGEGVGQYSTTCWHERFLFAHTGARKRGVGMYYYCSRAERPVGGLAGQAGSRFYLCSDQQASSPITGPFVGQNESHLRNGRRAGSDGELAG